MMVELRGPFNTVDEWFAWRPVVLSVWGNNLGRPDPRGKFFVRSKPRRWAWLKKVKRIRGIFLAGNVYMEL